MNHVKIIYEDNHLIGVVKPFNLLTQKDRTGDRDLMEEIKDYLKEKYHKPGNVFLGMVHRLDRPAGGVMVFARTSKAAGRLSKQWREGTVRKLYLAWVEGTIENPEFRKETSYLRKNEKTNKVAVHRNPAKDARKSELLYRAIKKKGASTLVEIELLTGRPHQIRAQMAFLGHPVLGDIKYGASKPLKNQNIALFSHYLAFEHPVSKDEIILAAEPDPGWER
ncbi:MAG: RluA family pseudouridine synthase [Nitrospinae bacterium]|nr:RluA family pseudouridine synthase [Nitrospinota bacterium]